MRPSDSPNSGVLTQKPKPHFSRALIQSKKLTKAEWRDLRFLFFRSVLCRLSPVSRQAQYLGVALAGVKSIEIGRRDRLFLRRRDGGFSHACEISGHRIEGVEFLQESRLERQHEVVADCPHFPFRIEQKIFVLTNRDGPETLQKGEISVAENDRRQIRLQFLMLAKADPLIQGMANEGDGYRLNLRQGIVDGQPAGWLRIKRHSEIVDVIPVSEDKVTAGLSGTIVHARHQVPEILSDREIELRESCSIRRIEQVQPLIVLIQRIKMRKKLNRGRIHLAEHCSARHHAETTA